MDRVGHDTCGGRDGRLCWVLMLLLWLGLIVGLLLFMLAFMFGCCMKKIPEEVHVEDYYYRNKETVYN